MKLTVQLLILMALLTNLSARDNRDVYFAKLSYKDHHNSSGIKLHTVAGILRQDRANYHKFYRRDAEDTPDFFFKSKRNRSIYEGILQRSSISRSVRNAILYGEPRIMVTIYDSNYVSIELL
jgi:hypothetical protein